MTDLSASEERQLYATDRPAWLAYVAPRMAEKLALEDDDTIGAAWGRLARDYQQAVWPRLTVETQRRIRAARTAAYEREHA